MTIKQLFIIILMGVFFTLASLPVKADAICTYNTYKWNTRIKKAVDIERVEKSYQQLQAFEIEPYTGCSICEQDQSYIDLPGIEPFQVCKFIAEKIEKSLMQLKQQGAPLQQIIAYRPGMTRGDTDENGNRTRYSNHSFGVALDINPQLNGLYTNCTEFGPQCRLIRGGPWRPGIPGTLTQQSPIVQSLKQIGFRWGGNIAGRQKDFMHFSPSGY